MKLLRAVARTYPWRTTVMLACLLLGGLAEGIGVSGFLPLLAMAASGGDPSANAALTGSAPLGAMVIDGLARAGLPPTAEVLLALILGGTVLKSGFIMLANQQVAYTTARVATDLRLALIRALLAARWEHHVGTPLGTFASAVTLDAARASEAYVKATSIVRLLVQGGVYVIVAALVSWPATLVALLTGLFIATVLHRLVRRSRRAGVRQTMFAHGLLKHFTDTLQAIKPLKAMGREHLLEPLLERETQRLNRALQLEVTSRASMRALQEPLIVVVLAAGVCGALTILALPVSTIIMLVLLSTRILDCLGKVQRDVQELVVHASAFDAARALIRQAAAARETGQDGVAPTLRREIRLAAVHVTRGAQVVLRDASLVMPAGRMTVITGASGAGKTTIADLIAGLIRPAGGAVLIDDVPLAAVNLARWRAMIGYVPQDAVLMHETIALNVTLGDPTLTSADVDAALRAAGAADFVSRLPLGPQTPVGERGLRLSGGQRQRIVLARALVRQPALLILDEATTALDADAEAHFCATLARLRGQTTILAICHQGRLAEMADRLYRVAGGTTLPVALRPPAAHSATGA